MPCAKYYQTSRMTFPNTYIIYYLFFTLFTHVLIRWTQHKIQTRWTQQDRVKRSSGDQWVILLFARWRLRQRSARNVAGTGIHRAETVMAARNLVATTSRSNSARYAARPATTMDSFCAKPVLLITTLLTFSMCCCSTVGLRGWSSGALFRKVAYLLLTCFIAFHDFVC